ncbi:SOS response-associated peptidase [Paenarthrobacter sp. Z7-10]|uniref:SOS response-associated peptidase n=1 Tax=Paenarthrobacter sp. Z7-10 TaxID=2787635 RepID=UPI0022A90881|nr:SOS response-associated peptidase [Paenarthrobacter sp. Z7-10]MCZ2402064.1 SOS response-associated peptidase [Paenarthrobacter sp. Z7-10]
MCGRYVMARSTGDLVAAFDVTEPFAADIQPSFNIAPTDVVPLVVARKSSVADEPSRELITARWGLVPSWSKDAKSGARLINARRETVTEKPSFRQAAAKRRALVVADGYFEWQKTPDGKIPTYLHAEDEAILAFAGLFEYWSDPSLPDDHPDRWLRTCTIITTAAADSLGHIHDRTPMIVPADLQAEWLDPETTRAAEVEQLLDAIPEPRLVPRVVSTEVNSVRNNGSHLIEPAAEND